MFISKLCFSIIFILSIILGCSDKASNPTDVQSYQPLRLDDWDVSTPVRQGVDPTIIDNAYQKADSIATADQHLYSLLIIKNGYLIAEKYFNGRNSENATISASVTKSYVSALTGLAIQEGYISSVEQKMVDFFPEFDLADLDPRKGEITIRQILQMRSGYPSDNEAWDIFFSRSVWIPLLDDLSLTSNPGTQFGYSEFTAHIMGVIIQRSTGELLSDFGQDNLFDPLEYQHDYWPYNSNSGYNWGHGDLRIKPRDMAKLGLLFLNEGVYKGTQIISREWILESLQPYSSNVFGGSIVGYFGYFDYGYLWWSTSITAGGSIHRVNFAWGKGGQLIMMIPDLNMVIITTASYQGGDFSQENWRKEKAIFKIIGKFIYSLLLQ